VPVFARLEESNEAYVASGRHRDLPVRPSQRLAVVTCMDCRIDVYAVLGLELGDVHVIRTAGGRVTDDVLRSLVLSTHLLGVNQVAVITHTDCGLRDPDGTLVERLSATMPRPPAARPWLAFAEPEQAALEDCERLLSWAERPDDLVVAGYVLDVADGSLRKVIEQTTAASR
jgi:carbonic anhydrase